MLDIIGIGALNLDYVATRQRLSALDADLVAELAVRFEHGVERPVTEREVDETIKQMGKSLFEVFLGGSSFNTIHAMAALNPGLRLGYVGVAGRPDTSHLGFVEALTSMRVDTRFVESMPLKRSGVCVSYISDGERSLLTYPGANKAMAQLLKQRFDQLLEYIVHCRVVHVSSFFDDKTPALLVDLIRRAKERNPWLRLSFDPGHHWLVKITPEIRELLRLSDYLFLNSREFENLGHFRPGTSDLVVVSNIFEHCAAETLLIVLKRYDVIKMFYRILGRLMELRYENVVMPPDAIEDATGAGDVFSAGFITALLVPGLEYRHGIELGLRLVRSKLLVAGTRSFDSFSGIFSSLLNEITAIHLNRAVESRTRVVAAVDPGTPVFIGHGQSPLWSRVSEHLKERFALSVKAFESDSRTGRSVVGVMSELLDTCSFAIVVMTGDDETADGAHRARQNVLHEIGLFQGRLGFDRVAILVQDGIEKFSNIDGLQYISFGGNKIEHTYFELEQMLRRERVIT